MYYDNNNNLDSYLIQETHLAGDFEQLIYDYYLIHHGPETQPTNGAKGGVATIVLSPELAEAWKNSGKAKT